jgi:hypothetical protein
MASFIDINGAVQKVELDATVYREAADKGLSVEALINQTYPVKAGDASAFEQLCASEGMFLQANRKFGIRPATMDAILNGTKIEAGSVVRDAVPTSRILFPAVQMSVLENKLREDNSGIIAAFGQMVAVDDSINLDRYERPFLNFSKPEGARTKAIAQLSEPTSMLSITVSDKSYRITGTSIGMEISDEAVRSTSMDLVTMAMQRQAEVEMAEKIEDFVLNFLNGDPDQDMAALSTVSGSTATASSFHGSALGAGVLSQKAWVKYLFNNSKKRTINYVITDIDGAMAIENRTGRPTVQGDNANSPRIDTLESIVNPMWPDQVKVFITTDPNWPANTIVGFDSRYAIHRVTSTILAYQAAEAYAMRRSTKFRIDTGSIAYRLFDEAWNVLTLT